MIKKFFNVMFLSCVFIGTACGMQKYDSPEKEQRSPSIELLKQSSYLSTADKSSKKEEIAKEYDKEEIGGPVEYVAEELDFGNDPMEYDEIFLNFVKNRETRVNLKETLTYVQKDKENYLKKYTDKRFPDAIKDSKMSAYGVFVPDEGGKESVLFCLKEKGDELAPNNAINLHNINKYSHTERQITELLLEKNKNKKGTVYIYTSGEPPCSHKENNLYTNGRKSSPHFSCVLYYQAIAKENEDVKIKAFFNMNSVKLKTSTFSGEDNPEKEKLSEFINQNKEKLPKDISEEANIANLVENFNNWALVNPKDDTNSKKDKASLKENLFNHVFGSEKVKYKTSDRSPKKEERKIEEPKKKERKKEEPKKEEPKKEEDCYLNENDFS